MNRFSIVFGFLVSIWVCGGVGSCSSSTGDTDGTHGTEKDSSQVEPVATDGGPPVLPMPGEWVQHAHNPQRTSFAPESVEPPFRMRWIHVPVDVPAGEPGLPRNVQPVTGGGRVYLARGPRGVMALDTGTGIPVWENSELEGSAAATPAYDGERNLLWVVTTAGYLYGLNPAAGGVIRQVQFDPPQPRIGYASSQRPGFLSALEAAGIAFPPLLIDDTVYISARQELIAYAAEDLSERWRYAAESDLETCAAGSSTHQLLVVATSDLHVHGVDIRTGTRRWRVRPYAGIGEDSERQYLFSWPVIAEISGVVLMRVRYSWGLTTVQWPTTLAQMRSLIEERPELQALHALSLADGSEPFRPLVGHGGFGNGDYMPMGSPPVVWSDGLQERAYTVIRGDDTYDFRWDSRFGELVINASGADGLHPGDVRWINFDPAGVDTPWPTPFLLTDEQPFVSMAGNSLFGGHWAAGHAMEIVGRDSNRGTFENPITTRSLPPVLESTTSCAYSPSHQCGGTASPDTDGRVFGPNAFYIRHSEGAVYDRHWGEYATWIVSGDVLIFRACTGALMALESARGESPGEAPAPAQRAAVVHSSSTAPEPFLRVDWREARRHVGESVELEGNVAYAFRTDKAFYIAFQKPHQGAPMGIIDRRDESRFGDIPTVRPGQRVILRGTLRWYQGDPVVDIRGPESIVISDKDRGAEP